MFCRGNVVEQLSEGQSKLVPGIVQGQTNRMIARDLGLAEQTVKNQLCRAYRKLGVHCREQFVDRVLSGQVRFR